MQNKPDKEVVRRNALEFLRNIDVGVVATVDENGQPYVSPVYYAEGGDFEIYFFATSASRKSQNIMKNSKVAFSAGTGPEHICVTVRGIAKLVEGHEYDRGSFLITQKAEKNSMDNWPIRKVEELKRHYPYLYKIEPQEVTFLNIDSSKEPSSIADHFHQIAP